MVVVGTDGLETEIRLEIHIIHHCIDISTATETIKVAIDHKAYNGIFRRKEIRSYPCCIGLNRHNRIVILIIRALKYTIFKEIPVDDKVIELFAIGVIIITKY